VELFPEHELQCGEWQVTIERRLVAVEECPGALRSNYCTYGIDGAAIVVAGLEVGVLISALKLQSCFEDLRWYVDNGRSEVAKKS
jgi:hypothetical protein